MAHDSARRRLTLAALWLLAIGLIALALLPRGLASARPDAVGAAWERARAAGSYHFAGSLVQATIPVASARNIGRASTTEQLHLQGQASLAEQRVELRLWPGGGSLAGSIGAVAVKVEDGRTWTREGEGPWQESAGLTDGIAPQGDFMAFLAAVRDVRASPPETRAGITFTRYSFALDGPRLAEHMRAQLEAAMRQRGELAPGARLQVPDYYRDMAGTGELWVGADGLPVRQVLDLAFPERNGERVNAQITLDFSQFGRAAGLAGLLADPADLAPFIGGLLTLAGALGLAAALVAFRHSRRLEAALAVALTVALVAGPLFSGLGSRALLDARAAQAAEQADQRATGAAAREVGLGGARPGYSPHVDPLAAGAAMARLAAPGASTAMAPAQQTDSGVDGDGDGLSDFVEERVGTDPAYNDSDEDGIPDAAEVRGFSLGGQTWYSDALAADSNGDGIADTIEYDADTNTTPDDSDGDRVPDLFDDDNDNDRVPDRIDLAPFSRSNPDAPFTNSQPLRLTLNNLEAGKPTFVEVQLRPRDPEHLWYALNPLDWPDDQDGQVRDVDRGSGELQLLPMLEIRVEGASTNLPPQADLAPFSISVNDLPGGGKVAYVPLSIIGDEATGERVAFTGRMRYLPGGSWATPHQLRLVWVAQVKSDIPCEPGSQGCSADGYQYNVAQALHSYYDDWTLTGLNVQEEHGSKTAIIYEDPAADEDLGDEPALWALSAGLNNAFVTGQDLNGDGERDLTVAEIARRFDHASNGAVSLAERWELPNILRVEQKSYSTFPEAMASTAMTETTRILGAAFDGPWGADNSLMPKLMFASETSYRALGLDALRASGGFVTLSGQDAVVNMQPAGQSRVAVLTTTALKWTPYCRASGGSWGECEADVYAEALQQRYGSTITLPGDIPDPQVAAGRAFLVLLYDQALRAGVTQVVQQDSALISSRYTLMGEDQTITMVRTAFAVAAPAAAFVADTIIMGRFVNKTGVLRELGRLFQELAGTVRNTVFDLKLQLKDARQIRSVGAGLVATAAVVITGLSFLALTLSGEFGDQASKIALKVVIIAGLTLVTVVSPVLAAREWAAAVKLAGQSANIFKSGVSVLGTSYKATVVGTVVAIAVTWGFFIFSVVSNKVSAFSPAFNKALAETIAATLYLVFLAIVSVTVIGTIIVAIIGVIDLILTAICELGVDALRGVPGLGGACFTIGNATIKGLSYLLYQTQEMIDLSRADLIVAGVPDLALVNPDTGYTAGSQITISMPVTTTVVHKNPDPANGLLINLYLWLFSQENLRSSTFRYSLSRPGLGAVAAERDQMKDEWQDVRERNADEGGKYVLTPMYRGQASQTPSLSATLPAQPGLNRVVDFYLNMGYAVPAYECISLPTAICWTRGVDGDESVKIDALRFDVFPATLDAFMAMTTKPDGGRGLGWDAGFPSLPDADGDGLRSVAHNGPDPDDATWDSDGDGLGDALELERQSTGANYSPRLWDSDDDGLADAQELAIGSNPARADSDGDGLSDAEETRHLVYTFNTSTGRVETDGTLAGGVDVRVNATLTLRVASNPLSADSDADGLSDAAEYELAASADEALRVDEQGRPYHPLVANTPPVSVALSTSDPDGFLAPGQTMAYTSTVVSRVPLSPGALDVTLPAALGASPPPALLPFDPNTFTGAQTVTHGANLTVGAGAATGGATLSSAVRARLAGGEPASWAWAPVSPQASLSPLKSSHRVRYTEAVAQAGDNFQVTALTADPNRQLIFENTLVSERKDVLSYLLPGGATTAADNDTDTLDGNLPLANLYLPPRADNRALLGRSSPSVACNNAGVCMVVWDQFDQCNTITINSLTVVTAAADGGSGIEPIIYLVRDANDVEPRDGGYLRIWDPGNSGSNDTGSGVTRGPNANDFPVTKEFCGPARLDVFELDVNERSGSLDPAQTNWDGLELIDQDFFSPNSPQGTYDVTLIGAGNTIRLNVTLPEKKIRTVAGALLAPDGSVQRVEFPLATTLTDRFDQFYRPVVASDGTNFLAAWELANFTLATGGVLDLEHTTIVRRLFDASGNPLTTDAVVSADSAVVVPGANFTRPYAELALAYAGDRYRLTRLLRPGADVGGTPEISSRDLDTSGNLIAGSARVLASDAARDDATREAATADLNGHRLAYDPATQRTMLVYQAADGSVKAKLFDASFALVRERALAASASSPQVAYHTPSGGWLVGWQDAAGALQVLALTADGSDLVDATPRSVLTAPARSSALACPALGSTPVVDLRFDEPPGATSFLNSAGAAAGTCSGPDCPLAGYPGATDGTGAAVGVPPSDYAARFDGQGDSLAVADSLADNFSVAFWIKTDLATGIVPVATQGQEGAFWSVGLFGGSPYITAGAVAALDFDRKVSDGAWHHVVGTRSRGTGRVAMYIDGVLADESTGNTDALTAASAIQIGGRFDADQPYFSGLLDNLQVYPAALSAASAQALYRSEQQSFCVGTGATAASDGVQWARLSLSQSDTRGGALTTATSLGVTVDADRPASTIAGLSNNERVKGGTTLIIGGEASDATSGVALVEVSLNGGPWQPATGAESWSFALPLAGGDYTLRTRATDAVGNVEAPGAGITIVADNAAPTVTLDTPPALSVPGRDAEGLWTVALSGDVSDGASGVAKVEVRLLGATGEVQDHGWQQASVNSGAWSITYALDRLLASPDGAYTAQVRAVDGVGNATADDAATATLNLDASGPRAALSDDDATRRQITSTPTLTGVISDTAGLAGLRDLEIAFTPIEQAGALADGITTDQAEPQLSRDWHPVSLAQSGPGVFSTTWSAEVPAGLEGEYQIDMRASDQLGNTQSSSSLWRGVIDNMAPRLTLSVTPTGASYVDTTTGTERYAVSYVCSAEDRNLDEKEFRCPGSDSTPGRGYLTNAVLQRLFPDRTIRNTLTLTYTLWQTSPTPAATMRACDTFGACATESTQGAGTAQASEALLAVMSDAAPALAATLADPPVSAAPRAVVVAPLAESYVTTGGDVAVTVAAEAAQSLREVTISLDGAVVQTIGFGQDEAVTRVLRTVALPVAAEGTYTLVATASDWAGGAQSTSYPVRWTLDRTDPALSMDTVTLEADDTWLPGSGMLRFAGSASDGNGLAAVQLRVGDLPFADATVLGDGTWRIAYRVDDPEGRALEVSVRAIDRAGRVTTLARTVPTSLSAADAPDTAIAAGPADPSAVNSASFTFSGTPGGRSVTGFECGLDGGAFEPCASPWDYGDLSKGAHVFAVRAVDAAGNVDLTPATYSWNVLAGQPDAVISAGPEATTASRQASFSFDGAGAARFECSLDGAAYATCASPQTYAGLADGPHTFLVRGVNTSGQAGPAERYTWTVENALPVASDATFIASADLTVAIVLPADDANGDALRYRVVDWPQHGVLVGVAPNLTYLPDTGSYEQDSFSFRAADGVGESNLATLTIIIDNVPPVTTASSTVSANGVRGTVTLTATDNLTGVASTSYSINGGPVQTYTGTLNLAGLGVYDVSYYSTDVAGNVEEARTITVSLAPSCAPLGAAAAYNVFALGDLSTTGLNMTGGVAAGRDASLSRLSISGDVVVGRDASGGGGTIGGRLIVGGTDSTNRNTLTVRGGRQQGSPINFAAEAADLLLVSDSYGAMQPNGAVTTQSKSLRLTGTNATRNVFAVTAAQLAAASGITISVPAGSLTVINIAGTSFTLGSMGVTLTGATAARVLWNAPQATAATISRVALPGTLLVPRAALSASGGSVQGAVIPASYNGTSSGTQGGFTPCS